MMVVVVLAKLGMLSCSRSITPMSLLQKDYDVVRCQHVEHLLIPGDNISFFLSLAKTRQASI